MTRSRQLSTNYRVTALFVVLALVAGAGALATGGRAASAAPLHAVPGLSVTVPAGGTTTINVRAVALTPGAAVPAGPLALAQQPLAPERLRTAVYYGIDWGYADTAPAQVALAVWQLQDGVWQSPDHAIAERISAAAATLQGTPSWNPDGRNLLQAVAEGHAGLSELTLTPLADSAWAGDAALSVTNSSPTDAVFYLPYGTVFSGQGGSVIAWATAGLPGAQVTPTAQQVEPTATTPSEPTATATPEVPPAPAPPSIKGGTATPVAEATATPRPKDATATPEPPVATATETPEPPSATPSPTGPPSPEPTIEPAPVQEEDTGRTAPGRRQEPVALDAKTAAGKAVAAAPESPLPPSGSATATPISAGDVPGPMGTSVAVEAPVLPQPVGTQPGAAIPSPVQTVIGTKPPSTQLPAPGASVSPTRPLVPSASPTVEEKSEPTAAVAPVEQAPVQQPTPAPTPMPVPPTPVEDTGEGPVINVAPGDADPGAAGGTGQPSAGENSSAGAPQTYNPNTGGGPSFMPLWLGLLSAFMVLGGWSLRRVARPGKVPVKTEDDRQ